MAYVPEEERANGPITFNPTYALNNRSSKPVAFVDVDGVINSYPPPKERFRREREFSNTHVNGYWIWYDPKVVDFFNALHASGLVDIIWLTTWRSDARTELAPALGLSDWPAVTKHDGSAYYDALDWWKWKAVQDFLGDNAEERPVIWIDDDLHKNAKRRFRAQFDPTGERSLLITPFTMPGLEQEHLDSIMEFLTPYNPKKN